MIENRHSLQLQNITENHHTKSLKLRRTVWRHYTSCWHPQKHHGSSSSKIESMTIRLGGALVWTQWTKQQVWTVTLKLVLTWMLSSTFFHWQKRVNLSLREKTQKVKCEFSGSVEQMMKLFHPSPPPVSPLDELLEDLPSQAVTDLHYVWLQEDRQS